MRRDYRRAAVYLVFLVLSWMPMVVALVYSGAPVDVDDLDFSVYNDRWKGCSELRSTIKQMGYDTAPLISSLNVLNSFNRPVVFVSLGPSRPYNPLEVTALLGLMRDGGGMLIADDFGTANEVFLYLGQPIGFTHGVLMDVGSFDRNPVLPIIRSFTDHPVTEGLERIEMNYGTALKGQAPSLAQTTFSSWLDLDGDRTLGPREPLGPFTVISGFEVNESRVVMVSDPSVFINDMINRADNRRLAQNTIAWLSEGKENPIVVFDEAHLSWPPNSQTFVVGRMLEPVNSLSSNWLISPIFPIIAVLLIRRWMPKTPKPKAVELTEVFRRKGETYFSAQLRWYKEHRRYNQAIAILYRRMRRLAVRQLDLTAGFDIDAAIEKAVTRRPELNQKSLRRLFNLLETVSKGKREVKENEEFLRIYFRMKHFMAELEAGNVEESTWR